MKNAWKTEVGNPSPEKLTTVLQGFTGGKCHAVNDLLRQWEYNKADLRQFLGGIKVEKTISLQHPVEMIELLRKNFIISHGSIMGYGQQILADVSIEDVRKNRCNIDYIPHLENYKKGQRLSSVLRSLIEDQDNYVNIREKQKSKREWFDIVFSRFLQSLKVVGVLAVSIDPIDYLTMSYNQSDWQSCHRPKGEYRGGMLSYMTDCVSIVAYLYNGNEVEYKEGFTHNSKNWRQMLYLDLKNKACVFSRHYPQTISLLPEEIKKLIAEKFSANYGIENTVNNYIDEDPDYNIEDCENALHYNDLLNSDIDVNVMCMGKNNRRYFLLIGNAPICTVCGHYNVSYRDLLICNHCLENRYTCYECGTKLYKGRDKIIRYNNYDYCEECYNALFKNLSGTAGENRGAA